MKNKKLSKDSKKIILIIAVILAVILVLNIIITILENKNEMENNKASIGFSSIKEILDKYECEFIKETKSKDSKYVKDLYVKFKYNTFEQNESKKRHYENIISYLSDFINANYRIIDEEKDLLIEVKKQTNSEGTVIFTYIINGDENYFLNKESEINLKNYEEDNNTNIEVNSNILNGLLQNNWDKDRVNFGSKDSNFDKYEIYFDEGIEVRNISGKIYNIVFTKNYNQEIINGIKVGTDYNEIIQKLGEPTFGSKEGFFIGYKNSEFYVFFLENSISVYKNEKTEMKKFENLLEKYINRKIDIKEFMNELTYLWPDYEEYTYNASYIYINYPNKGIRIKMDSDTPLGITIYKNCNITDKISEFIKEGKISSSLKEDLIEVTMQDKINKEDGYKYVSLLNDGEETNEIISNWFYHYLEFTETGIDRVLFISKDGANPNRELNEKINQGFFINDNIFVYSIQNKGIYAYDVISQGKSTLVEGQDEFILEEYKDGILKYDDKQISLIME